QLLQALHLGADGRLRDAERLGGASEAAHVDDRDEGAKKLRRDVGHGPPVPGPRRADIRADIGSPPAPACVAHARMDSSEDDAPETELLHPSVDSTNGLASNRS